MKTRLVQKNDFFATKISFLMLSFVIVTIAITVQHDVWPFLQENLPVTERPQTMSPLIFFFGFFLPIIWLYKDWHIQAIRYALVSMISIWIVQISTEALVSHYFFASMIVPTASLYTVYRLIQLINLQRILFKGSFFSNKALIFRSFISFSSFVFWGVILFNLTFITFPKIIPDFS